jgi:hypothetical protein
MLNPQVSLGAEDDEAEEEERQVKSSSTFSQVEPPADMTLIDPADVELCNPERPVSTGGYGVVHRAHWNGVEVRSDPNPPPLPLNLPLSAPEFTPLCP